MSTGQLYITSSPLNRTVRCFIAIELPDDVKSIISGLQQSLQKKGADIRWVRTENIHLTLKFLGDIEIERADSIMNVIKGTCKDHNCFSIEIKGIGTFPAGKTPRVLWAAVNNNEELLKLQAGIDRDAAFLGFSREKRGFSPHLTLGRFRSSRDKNALMDNIEIMKYESFGQFDVRSIYLIKSELKPSGAVYSILAEFPLGP